MFRKKAKKEPPKAEHPIETNAQLRAALDQVDQSVTVGLDRLRERYRETSETFDSIAKDVQGLTR